MPAGAPVVVDWRAGVATPFYRATLADPLGLHLRRRFVFNGRELADVFEEDFDDPDSLAGSGGVPDPLLAELGRARTGQMRDIVATIQARAGHDHPRRRSRPASSCRADREPGKTAVGLHRAAFLLYEHRERLTRGGVLVVGPNPVFLRYISQVLPSLGETSATQTTVDGLLGLRFRIVAEDADDVAAVKGDVAHARRDRAGAGRCGSHSGRRDRAGTPAAPVPDRRGRAARDGRRRRAPATFRSPPSANGSGVRSSTTCTTR